MRRALLLLAALLCAALGPSAAGPERPQAERVPEPRVVDAAGFKKAMADLRGHPVVVNFWASWCEPCIEEFPELVREARRWRARGVRFVSISADEAKDLGPVKRTLAKFGAPFDLVLVAAADGGKIIEQTDADWSGALPASFLYDAAGRKIQRRIGKIDGKRLAEWLTPLVR